MNLKNNLKMNKKEIVFSQGEKAVRLIMKRRVAFLKLEGCYVRVYPFKKRYI